MRSTCPSLCPSPDGPDHTTPKTKASLPGLAVFTAAALAVEHVGEPAPDRPHVRRPGYAVGIREMRAEDAEHAGAARTDDRRGLARQRAGLEHGVARAFIVEGIVAHVAREDALAVLERLAARRSMLDGDEAKELEERVGKAAMGNDLELPGLVDHLHVAHEGAVQVRRR